MTYDEFVRRWRRAMFAAADELHREFFDLYETREALAFFGRNLAVGGSLCAAHQIGERPPMRRTYLGTTSLGVANMTLMQWWRPGDQWPVTEPEDGWE